MFYHSSRPWWKNTRSIKIDAITFFLLFQWYQQHLFENIPGSCTFEVLYTSNFTITQEENTPSFKKYWTVTWLKNLIDLQKFKYYSLLSNLPVKIKRSEFFVVNNNTQKRSFCKLKVKGERSFREGNI